ncbi:MAG: hypothetical protein IT558_04035 [Alphaproteobacteria bacterium]|nr:hypothetical protein [Alphaproteobacteria bacterium]
MAKSLPEIQEILKNLPEDQRKIFDGATIDRGEIVLKVNPGFRTGAAVLRTLGDMGVDVTRDMKPDTKTGGMRVSGDFVSKFPDARENLLNPKTTYAANTGPGFRVQDHHDYEVRAAKTTAEIRKENMDAQHAANKAVNAKTPPVQPAQAAAAPAAVDSKTPIAKSEPAPIAVQTKPVIPENPATPSSAARAPDRSDLGAQHFGSDRYGGRGAPLHRFDAAGEERYTAPPLSSAPATTPKQDTPAGPVTTVESKTFISRDRGAITTIPVPGESGMTSKGFIAKSDYDAIKVGIPKMDTAAQSSANFLAKNPGATLPPAEMAHLEKQMSSVGLKYDNVKTILGPVLNHKGEPELFVKGRDGGPMIKSMYTDTIKTSTQEIVGGLKGDQKTAAVEYVRTGKLDPALKTILTDAKLMEGEKINPTALSAMQDTLKTDIAKADTAALAAKANAMNGGNARPVNPDGTANKTGLPNSGRVGGIVVGNDPKAYLEAHGIEAKPGQVSVTANGGVQNLKTVFAEAAQQGTPEQRASLEITKIKTSSPYAAPASATPPAQTTTPVTTQQPATTTTTSTPAPGTPETLKQGSTATAAAASMASTMTTGARVLTTGLGGAALASGTIGTINALREGDNVGAAVHGTTAVAGAGTLLSTTTTMSPGLSAAFQRASLVGVVAGTALEVSREKLMEDKINAGVKGVVTAGAGMATGALLAGGTVTLTTVAAPVVVAGTVGYAAKKIIDDDKANRAEFQESLKKTASTTATFKHGLTDLTGKPTIGDYGNLRSFQTNHPDLKKLDIHDVSKPENMAKLEQALKDEVTAQTKIKTDNTSIIPDLMRPGSGVSDRMAAENKLARLEATQKELTKFKEDLGNFENKKSAPAFEKQAPKMEGVPAHITQAPRSTAVQTAENGTPARLAVADQYGVNENTLRADLGIDLQKSFNEATAGNIDMPEPAAPEAGAGLTQQQTRISTAPALA